MSVRNGKLRMENGKFIYIGKILLKILGFVTIEVKDVSIPKKEQKCR